jgi:CDP-diacylglycerol---glycerol-3-phosphate 3-phosphatidyltransferase
MRHDREDSAVIWVTWANALSVLRLLLAAPCAYAIWLGAWPSAVALFAVAVVTDVFDGIVARRRGQATPLGGLLDHSIDAIFVTTTLSALTLIDVVPALLPPLVIAAFSQYAWDSQALRGAPLRANVLGRWNGIGYYALVGTVIVANALGLDWPSRAVLNALAWLLILSTLTSMGDRALALWRIRRAG